jgi:hypothetical protein
MQWEAEFLTKEELSLPANHLRACDIADNVETLCIDQHDGAVRERLRAEAQDIAASAIPVTYKCE